MSAVVEVDPGPMARLEAVLEDVGAPQQVFDRLAEGESLREIAADWGVPRGRFVEWFTSEHAGLYDSALRARAGELAHETLGIADGAVSETVGVDKLRVDTRLRLASHWDRARYGAAKDAGAGGVTVVIDRTCGGTVQIEAPGGSKLLVSGTSADPRSDGTTIQGERDGDHGGAVAG